MVGQAVSPASWLEREQHPLIRLSTRPYMYSRKSSSGSLSSGENPDTLAGARLSLDRLDTDDLHDGLIPLGDDYFFAEHAFCANSEKRAFASARLN